MGVDAQLLKAGAKLQGGAEKELGAHGLEILLLKGALDTRKEGGEFYEFVFEGGEVLFLEPFDMDRFEHLDGAAGERVGLPIEEGGFGDAELFGDGAETPALAAQCDEMIFKLVLFF